MTPALRQALANLLEGKTISELKPEAQRLSARYRAEVNDGRMHLDSLAAAHAYIAARMPATLAAVKAVFTQVEESCALFSTAFAPQTLLDCGAGPGTVLFAAVESFPSLRKADLLEQSAAIKKVGQSLTDILHGIDINWHDTNLENGAFPTEQADLVTLSYVLDELSPAVQDRLIDNLWLKTKKMLVLVEPGTPSGWQRLMRQRARLIAEGGHMLAPCPHNGPCPLTPPDWCHFAARLERSRTHRLTKGGDVPWEDEKFSFIAVLRDEVKKMEDGAHVARVLSPPQKGSGKVTLKLCCENAAVSKDMLTRSSGEVFKTARRCHWGDVLKLPSRP